MKTYGSLFPRSALAVAVALVAAAPALAQNTTAAIGGRVATPDGKPVAGATVVVLHRESGSVSTFTTDADGRYSGRGLRVGGPYRITVTKDGKIYLQKEVVTADALVPKLQAISQNGYDQRIFVRGDKTVAYDRVMVVMGLLASAGFTHIGLVTDVAKPKSEQH